MKDVWDASKYPVLVMFCSNGDVKLANAHEPDVVLTFTEAEWAAFAEGAKAGEFDEL